MMKVVKYSCNNINYSSQRLAYLITFAQDNNDFYNEISQITRCFPNIINSSFERKGFKTSLLELTLRINNPIILDIFATEGADISVIGSNKVPLLYSLARDGNSELLQRYFYYSTQSNLAKKPLYSLESFTPNIEFNVNSKILDACINTPSDLSNLKNYGELIEDNTIIIQNFCYTFIPLTTGKILSLHGVDVDTVMQYLANNNIAKFDNYHGEYFFVNINPGHGFMGYRKVKDINNYFMQYDDITWGFYPSDDNVKINDKKIQHLLDNEKISQQLKYIQETFENSYTNIRETFDNNYIHIQKLITDLHNMGANLKDIILWITNKVIISNSQYAAHFAQSSSKHTFDDVAWTYKNILPPIFKLSVEMLTESGVILEDASTWSKVNILKKATNKQDSTSKDSNINVNNTKTNTEHKSEESDTSNKNEDNTTPNKDYGSIESSIFNINNDASYTKTEMTNSANIDQPTYGDTKNPSAGNEEDFYSTSMMVVATPYIAWMAASSSVHGDIKNEFFTDHYIISEIKNALRVKFYTPHSISDKIADKMLEDTQDCTEKNEEKCFYHISERNCISYTKEFIHELEILPKDLNYNSFLYCHQFEDLSYKDSFNKIVIFYSYHSHVKASVFGTCEDTFIEL
ncbi:MAG: hypothetical protein HRU36_03615 [Rickettsiales bacterium]|nr:hypothetical protein [Rickettsiales bacterium]